MMNLPAVISANVSNNDGTFSIPVTAPQAPGRYNFRWQLKRTGYELFGELTPNVSILVRTDVPSDFDGDGKADSAIFRPSEGNWYIRNSSNGATSVQGWERPATALPPPTMTAMVRQTSPSGVPQTVTGTSLSVPPVL